jgi:putative aldouronate transport system substrate-binding protein
LGNRNEISRRGFLRLSATGALAVGAAAVLAACGGTSAASTPASGSLAANPAASGQSVGAAASAKAPAAVKLPTTQPVAGLTPDLPGAPDGSIDPAWQSYPKNPIKTVPNPPGKGGDITFTLSITGNPPPPADQNALWTAVNKDIGANLKFNFVPFADYKTTRLPTLIAGGDLPDVLFIQPQTPLPGFPDFLKLKCTDLTPYLSGDGVKDYPNLASIPQTAWKNTVFNNAIWGVPVDYPLYLWVLWAHQEVLDEAGIPLPKSADDFKKALMAVNKPQQQQWGMSFEKDYGFGSLVGFWPAMFGSGPTWTVDKSGKFIYAAESDAFKAGISFAKDLYAAGLFHPNTVTNDVSTKRNDFVARRFVFDFDGFINASRVLFWPSINNFKPPAKYSVVTPFSDDGKRQPIFWPGQPGQTGSFGFVILKQAPADRIKEILGVLNYIAAPLGSQEYKLTHFGVEGTDHTLDDKGNPVLTAKGKTEATLPWPGTVEQENVIYYPTAQDYAPTLQDAEKRIKPFNVMDASVGLYSETYTSKGVPMQQDLADAINQVIRGSQPMSSFDQAISDWKSKGGDKMRAEFQQAYAAAQGGA